jgi:hypothetical protein
MKKKVIIFTSSYKRPLMLRQCILSVLNQSYTAFHSVNITTDNSMKTKNFDIVFNDLQNENLSVIYSDNNHTHFNNILAIQSVPNYLDYDIFIKMDDDDIYKKDYVKTIVDIFNTTDADVVSSQINWQLNGIILQHGGYNNLGNSSETDMYKMPMTYAFNRKCLDIIINIKKEENIYHFDDMIWRSFWVKNGMKHIKVNNNENIIWNIHGQNISTGNFLIK